MARCKTSTAQVAETLTKKEAVSGGAFRAWLNVYKNIFNFKGRTSRYEFWSFQLINSFVMVFFWGVFHFFLQLLFIFGDHLLPKFFTIMLSGSVIYFITNLSLFVRRLHDAGIPAWKGYCRPLICCFALFFYVMLVRKYGRIGEVIMFLSSYLYLYYVVKVFMTAGWALEEYDVFDGQEPRYVDIEHQKRAMKYAVIWFNILAFAILMMSPLISIFINYPA